MENTLNVICYYDNTGKLLTEIRNSIYSTELGEASKEITLMSSKDLLHLLDMVKNIIGGVDKAINQIKYTEYDGIYYDFSIDNKFTLISSNERGGVDYKVETKVFYKALEEKKSLIKYWFPEKAKDVIVDVFFQIKKEPTKYFLMKGFGDKNRYQYKIGIKNLVGVNLDTHIKTFELSKQKIRNSIVISTLNENIFGEEKI